MRNQQTGKFEYRKFIKRTHQEILGVGDTPETAKKDFKSKLEAYRAAPLLPTGEFVRSPGYTVLKSKDGRVRYEFRSDRKAPVLARPELAEFLQKERAKVGSDDPGR